MAAAPVIAAGVAVVVLMVVMVAADVGVIVQSARQEGLHSTVRAAGHAAVELDACRRQRHLSAAADAAADENIRL